MKRFPIVAHYKNIIFNTQGKALAIYKLPPEPYRFFSHERKSACVGKLEEMLSGFSGRGQILVLWEETDLNEGVYIKNIAGSIADMGQDFKNEIINHARSVRNSLHLGARTRRRYILFELSMKQQISNLEEFLTVARDTTLKTFLMIRPMEVPQTIKKTAEYAEQELFLRMSQYDIERANFHDLDFIIRRTADRIGILPPPLPQRDGGVFTPASISAFTDGCLLNEKIDHIEVIDALGKSHYQSFIFFVDIPKRISTIGLNLFEPGDLAFPYDVSMHFEIISPHIAKSMVAGKSRLLRGQMEEALTAGESPDISEEVGLHDSKVLISKLETGQPLARVSICLAVSSREKKDLRSKVNRLRQKFLPLKFRAVCPAAKQLDALFSFLPGSTPISPMIECDAGYIAGIGPHFASELGDPKGFFMGWYGQTPVFWQPGRPATELNKTNSLLISGALGSGKSHLAKLLAYFILLSGGYVLAIDPKAEYHPYLDIFPDAVRVVDLSPREGIAFSPFVLSKNEKRAKDIAIDYLTIALNATGNEPRRLAITQALEKLFTWPVQDRNMDAFGRCVEQVVKSNIHQGMVDEATQVIFLLRSMKETGIGSMIFGKSSGNFFEMGERMVVLNIKEVPLPRRGLPAERFTNSERLGVGMMFLLASIAREAAFGLPRQVTKMIGMDEAWTLTTVSEGERLIDEFIRISRSFNIVPALITQNITDIDVPAIVNNVSQVFCFRAEAASEVRANLRILGGSEDAIKADTFSRLNSGTCLYRDAEGRIGWLSVEHHPEKLLEIFDTKPNQERAVNGGE